MINQTQVTAMCHWPPGLCLLHTIGQWGEGWLGGFSHIKVISTACLGENNSKKCANTSAGAEEKEPKTFLD